MKATDLLASYKGGERNFIYSFLRNSDLKGAHLEGVNLNSATLLGVNLKGANLEGANFNSANLINTSLENVNLRGADLSYANLGHTSMRGADLMNANLKDATLNSINFRGAKNYYSFTAFGTSGRIVHCVKWDNGWMVHAGCFWGNLDDLEEAVRATHNSSVYIANIELLRTLN